MTAISPPSLTLSEFLALPETKPASEFINGQIIQKPMPKGRHSRLQGKLCAVINQVVEDTQVAYAFPELRCSFGGRSIIPDVSIFLWERLPFTPEGNVPDDFKLPPDWAIEILSPDQKPNKVIGNLLHCLDHGSQLGWFLDPDDESILILQPGQQPRLLQGDSLLTVLNGINLVLTVEQVYKWLTMSP